MTIMIHVGGLILYLAIGTFYVCFLQYTHHCALPCSRYEYELDRHQEWLDYERGCLCLLWPISILVWMSVGIAWLLTCGLGKVINRICPGGKEKEKDGCLERKPTLRDRIIDLFMP